MADEVLEGEVAGVGVGGVEELEEFGKGGHGGASGGCVAGCFGCRSISGDWEIWCSWLSYARLGVVWDVSRVDNAHVTATVPAGGAISDYAKSGGHEEFPIYYYIHPLPLIYIHLPYIRAYSLCAKGTKDIPPRLQYFYPPLTSAPTFSIPSPPRPLTQQCNQISPCPPASVPPPLPPALAPMVTPVPLHQAATQPKQKNKPKRKNKLVSKKKR